MIELKSFVSKISQFFSLDSGKQIQYLVYYLQVESEHEVITAKDIRSCFEALHLNSYSNIPAFLNLKSKKGKEQQFIKKAGGYILYSPIKDKIDHEVEKPIKLEITNSIFPH